MTGQQYPKAQVATDYLESSYTFDNEGHMTRHIYPTAHVGSTEEGGTDLNYGFDAMGRLNTLLTPGLISGVTYNAAGQPTVINSAHPLVNSETREYNPLGQMKSLTNGLRFEYDFPATTNDGRITAQRTYSASNTLVETNTYTYDPLNRLTAASGGGWSATYGYDGFTNLLTVGGSGPSPMSITVNPTNNRVNGWVYDANGNVTQQGSFFETYDAENRLSEATKNGSVRYGYRADNRRIYESRRGTVNAGGDTIEEYVTYWHEGRRMCLYKMVWATTPNSFVFAKAEENLYFGPKALRLGPITAFEWPLAVDRLGSIRRGSGKDHFPYGQENPSTTAGDKEKYATYRHDAATDLSYADQRYYATGAGRFMTADPAGDGLNWYAYVGGDPVNASDPSGLAGCRFTGSTAPDPAGVCPPGSMWYATADAIILRRPGDATNESDPSVSWAHHMLSSPTCDAIFNRPEAGSVELGPGLAIGVPYGGWGPSRVLDAILSNTWMPERALQLGFPSIYSTMSSSMADSARTTTIGSGSTYVTLSEPFFRTARPYDLDSDRDVWHIAGAAGPATDFIYRGMTLIHELGHVYNQYAGGILGGSKILEGDAALGLDGNRTQEAGRRLVQNQVTIFNGCAAPTLGLQPLDPSKVILK